MLVIGERGIRRDVMDGESELMAFGGNVSVSFELDRKIIERSMSEKMRRNCSQRHTRNKGDE